MRSLIPNISTNNYDDEETVLTWNHMTIHLYGKVSIRDQKEEIVYIMNQTITKYENRYLDRWKNHSLDYKSSMLKGIVVFRMDISDIEATSKLSQNKSEKCTLVHFNSASFRIRLDLRNSK